mmetsp:Transcript_24608/g.48086  ORF Transcript_24608/g.48086 Transcript_24608/m.48086 type:complete len:277 (-) Transcript_24608:285-1115(-)
MKPSETIISWVVDLTRESMLHIFWLRYFSPLCLLPFSGFSCLGGVRTSVTALIADSTSCASRIASSRLAAAATRTARGVMTLVGGSGEMIGGDAFSGRIDRFDLGIFNDIFNEFLFAPCRRRCLEVRWLPLFAVVDALEKFHFLGFRSAVSSDFASVSDDDVSCAVKVFTVSSESDLSLFSSALSCESFDSLDFNGGILNGVKQANGGGVSVAGIFLSSSSELSRSFSSLPSFSPSLACASLSSPVFVSVFISNVLLVSLCGLVDPWKNDGILPLS